MTSIRVFGIILGAVALVLTFVHFRSGRLSRFDFLFGSGIALSLIVVGARPDTVNLLRALLSLQDEQFSRLIAISIVSNTFLWLLFFQLRVRHADLHAQVDLLGQAVCLSEFQRAYPNIQRLPPVVAVIPAFNEASNIGAVLERMPQSVCGLSTRALVIDDGSSDATCAVAREAGALAIRSPVNRGGGAALRAGFLIASQLGAEVVVTMDADGQHDPAEMSGLVQPVVENRYDVVIGSRLLGEREPDSPVRMLGLHFFNKIIRLLTTASVTDCSNGFRALRPTALTILRLRQDQYHTSELIIEATKRRLRVGEAPVTVRRRFSGSSKKGKDWWYGLSFAKTIIKTWLR